MLTRLYANIELVVLCNYIRLCIIFCFKILGRHFTGSNLIPICTLWWIKMDLTPNTRVRFPSVFAKTVRNERSPDHILQDCIGFPRPFVIYLSIFFENRPASRPSVRWESLHIRTVTVRPARFWFCQIVAYDFNKYRFTLSANYRIRYVHAFRCKPKSKKTPTVLFNEYPCPLPVVLF